MLILGGMAAAGTGVWGSEHSLSTISAAVSHGPGAFMRVWLEDEMATCHIIIKLSSLINLHLIQSYRYRQASVNNTSRDFQDQKEKTTTRKRTTPASIDLVVKPFPLTDDLSHIGTVSELAARSLGGAPV